ncbi:MAG: cytidylate kinase family protein [Chloroflexi bacterium]|nr:cytidylate kinase family protein [Chloroflexota bacterium]
MAIITLSAAAFSGGRELAGRLAEKSGCRLVSREDIIDKTGHYGMSRNRLERARRRHVGILRRRDLEWSHYLAYVRAALSGDVRGGNLVYLGDDGQAALSGFPNMLSVSVVADTEYRIDNLLNRTDYGIDRKRAKRLIGSIDEKRARWRSTLYGEDSEDHLKFDLVIERTLMSIPEACELVQATAEQPQFQPTPKSLDLIERLTVAADLRARIAMDPDVVDDHIEIGVKDGVIVITGSVASTQDLEAIRGLLN